MERIWRRLAVVLGKRAGTVSVIGLFITLVAGLGLTRLQFQTGQDSYLNKDSQIAKDNLAYQKLFGGQAMVTLVSLEPGTDIIDYLSGASAKKIEKTAAELRKIPNVLAVIDPIQVLRFSHFMAVGNDGNPATSIGGRATIDALSRNKPDGTPQSAKSLKLRGEDAAANQSRLFAVPEAKRTLDNPDWVRFLLNGNDEKIRAPLAAFFPDDKHIQIVTRLDGNLSIADEGDASAKILAATKDLSFPKARVTTAGAPVLIDEINDYLKGGMLKLGGIAVLIMIVILALLFQVRWRLLPLLVILLGTTWAFGLAGFLGIPLNLVTIAGLPVMLGVGIDYAIQLHARVEEEVVIDRDPHPIQETARHLGPALLVVTFDAVFAFLALRFAKTPMIRDFGLLLAIGISVICMASIFLPLAFLGIREYKSRTQGPDFREGNLGRLVVRMGSLPKASAVPLAIMSLLIFVGGALVEGKLTIETDPAKWVNQKSKILADLHVLERETGSSSEMGVFVRAKDGNIFSKEMVNWIHDFTRNTTKVYGSKTYNGIIAGGNSFLSTVADTIWVPGTDDLPPLPEHVKEAYELARKVSPDVVNATVAERSGALNIIFRTGPSDLKERSVVVNNIRDGVKPPSGITATPSGLAVVGVGLLENLESGRVQLTYFAISFVFLFLAFRLRSVVRSLLSLVPVLIAVGAASLIAWIFHLKLSPMTAVGGPLVVAACTEFTSLILLRFVEERRRGLPPQEAVDVAAGRTGRAFIVSGLTAVSGVAVIATSSMPLLRDFGIIVGMNVAVALLSALIFLPPMLVWADQPGREWVSRRLATEEELALSRPGAERLPSEETIDLNKQGADAAR